MDTATTERLDADALAFACRVGDWVKNVSELSSPADSPSWRIRGIHEMAPITGYGRAAHRAVTFLSTRRGDEVMRHLDTEQRTVRIAKALRGGWVFGAWPDGMP